MCLALSIYLSIYLYIDTGSISWQVKGTFYDLVEDGLQAGATSLRRPHGLSLGGRPFDGKPKLPQFGGHGPTTPIELLSLLAP